MVEFPDPGTYKKEKPIDLPIKCVECGNWLDEELNQKGELEVGLCATCEESIKKEAYAHGYDRGYADARDEFE